MGSRVTLRRYLTTFPGHLAGQVLQALLPLFPVTLGVQLDPDPAAGTVDGIAGQLLDGVQSLAPAADQCARFLPSRITL